MAVISKDINDAAKHLREGHLVAIPTETVYGLAANALKPDVVVNIFKVKNRPSFDPLILHTDSLEKVRHYVRDIPNDALTLAEAFWPGPLTLVLPKKDLIPDLVTSGLDTVAVRIPNHPLTLNLLQKLDFPVAAPSANPFGYISPTTTQHVEDHLGKAIPYILDGGRTTVGIESTIVAIDENTRKILRLGGITQEQIENEIGPVDTELHQHSNPQAPGMMDTHYAPHKKILLGDISALLEANSTQKVGILSFQDTYTEIPEEHQIQLSPNGDLIESATNLFAALRKLDKMDIDLILAEKMPDRDLGRAINDRLRRASTR